LWFFGFVVLLICGFGGWGRLYAFETGGMKTGGWLVGSMEVWTGGMKTGGWLVGSMTGGMRYD